MLGPHAASPIDQMRAVASPDLMIEIHKNMIKHVWQIIHTVMTDFSCMKVKLSKDTR